MLCNTLRIARAWNCIEYEMEYTVIKYCAAQTVQDYRLNVHCI